MQYSSALGLISLWLFVTAAGQATLKHQALNGHRAASTCLAEHVRATRGVLAGVPYVRLSCVPNRRLLVYVQGGPAEAPVPLAATSLDLVLLQQGYDVIKPIYRGSFERRGEWNSISANAKFTYDIRAGEDPRKAAAEAAFRQAMKIAQQERAQLQPSVEELRRFIKAMPPYDLLFAESSGALLLGLACADDCRGPVINFVPAVVSAEAHFAAAWRGEHHVFRVEDTSVSMTAVVDGEPADLLRGQPARQKEVLRMGFIGYFIPYERVGAADAWKGNDQPMLIVVGADDRQAMLTGEEWRAMVGSRYPDRRACVVPGMAHEAPIGHDMALRCLTDFLRRPIDTTAGRR